MPCNKNKIALVDCNSFYVSCERLFNPSINKKPVDFIKKLLPIYKGIEKVKNN